MATAVMMVRPTNVGGWHVEGVAVCWRGVCVPAAPGTYPPSPMPSALPSRAPTTAVPTVAATQHPTFLPSVTPTSRPSNAPTTALPSAEPSGRPSALPSLAPTPAPTAYMPCEFDRVTQRKRHCVVATSCRQLLRPAAARQHRLGRVSDSTAERDRPVRGVLRPNHGRRWLDSLPAARR